MPRSWPTPDEVSVSRRSCMAEQGSKTLFVSRPTNPPPEPVAASLPFVVVDRSLGRLQVPRLLRVGGVQLVTLAEHYGSPADEQVEDTTWIAESAPRGWIAFMKDERIRRRPAERAVIYRYSARCFCLANANLKATEMAESYLYLANLGAIASACAAAGPFLYAVHARRIEEISID